MKKLYRVLVLSGAVLSVAACSMNTDNLLPDKNVEYQREAQAQRNLAVPPDLTSGRIGDLMNVPSQVGGGTNYSQYVADRRAASAGGGMEQTSAVLPQHPGIEVIRDGNQRWLKVDADADQVWNKLIAFWQNQGIPLTVQDPKIGVMRTAWLDNRAKIPNDFITDEMRKVFNGLYSTGQRDSYRVRLEREAGGKTDVFITQYGLKQVFDHGISGERQQTVWVPRKPDPQLAAIMLTRIMEYLGESQQQAKAKLASAKPASNRPSAQLVLTAGGTPKLIIDQDFPRAWNLVGVMLDQVGFSVQDLDRSKGIYYVRYEDPDQQQSSEGFFSKLKFWGSSKPKAETEYQVRVASSGPQSSTVEVYDSKGRLAGGDTPKRILHLLDEQFH